MVENRGFDILDYFVLVLKWKKFLLITFISVFVLSYLIIYIFIPVEYESSALIVPSGNESSMGGVSGLMKNLKDLPLGIGGLSKSSETDLYITIIYSRSTLEKLIGKFDLLKDYNLISMEKALKKLKKNIKGSLTRESAFEIIVRASSPQKAAEMTNFLLSLLNESVINLNITKSRNNREFLEKRYNDIRARLKDAEDSLQLYQQYSGLLEAKEQAHLMLNTYSKLQGDVIEKQMELSIMEKITAGDSPQLKLMKTQLEEYETELGKMKRNGGDKNVLLSLNSLPEKIKNYLRYYRNVETFSQILEFVIPMYEQAKFEEEKNIPVMQIIDRASVPEKKAYPPRALFSIIVAIIVLFISVFLIIIRTVLNNSKNPKVILIREEFKLLK